MRTYWDEFIRDYGERLHRVPLILILEAFFHYTRGEKDQCDRVLRRLLDPEGDA